MYQNQKIRLSHQKYIQLLVSVIESVGKCQICGTVNDLQGHHMIPKGRIVLDIKENILVVCFNCHDSIHKNLNGLSVDGVIKEFGEDVTKYLNK